MASKLTKKEVDTLGPTRHSAGHNLHLVVKKTGTRSWVFRATVKGKIGNNGKPLIRELGFGKATGQNRDAAMAKAMQFSELCREGIDPKYYNVKSVPNFQSFAEEYHELHKESGKNGKHKQQWINTLRTYAFPIFGNKPISDITAHDVEKTLMPIWLTKSETADRVKQRICTVMNAAKGRDYFEGENPVDKLMFSGILPKQHHKPKHHPAVPYQDAPKLYQELCVKDNVSHLALRLLMLTCVRSANVRFATHDQFDLENKRWTIPDEEMKMGEEHCVPLTDEMISIIRTMQRGRNHLEGYLFFTGDPFKPISENTMNNALKRQEGFKEYTGHGLRSTFRDWAAEKTDYKREIAETALAHKIGKPSEIAYYRTDHYDDRIPLMNDWTNYVTSKLING